MYKKISQIIVLLKEDLGLTLGIGFGVFLFVLFFQPFTIERFDFNDRLLFVAGLGAIVFVMLAIVRISFRWCSTKDSQSNYDPVFISYLSGFLLLALNSVAFAFYLRYVGFVNISFYSMFKVVLICLAPPVILRLYDVLKELKQQNESLINEKDNIQKEVEKYEEDYLNKSIEFESENNSENLTLLIADIAFIKSADNYVEIVYREDNQFKKQLIRNTLKNIEQQIKPYSNFIRCHRICIVNKLYIKKLSRNYNNHWLILSGYHERIPVSRQYLIKLKEII